MQRYAERQGFAVDDYHSPSKSSSKGSFLVHVVGNAALQFAHAQFHMEWTHASPTSSRRTSPHFQRSRITVSVMEVLNVPFYEHPIPYCVRSSSLRLSLGISMKPHHAAVKVKGRSPAKKFIEDEFGLSPSKGIDDDC